MIPSIRLMMFLELPSRNTSLTRTRNKRLVRITIGRSKKRVVRERIIGDINEAIPRIRNIFAIFDPSTFPIAISVFPEMLANTETISSGTLVPIATIVRPIIACDIQNFRASDTEPSIRTLPQKVRRINPNTTEPQERSISIYDDKVMM